MPDFYYNEMSLIEAEGDAAGVFRVRMIQPGISLNEVLYSEAVLRAAAPLFEGVRSLTRSDQEHRFGEGKTVKNLAGFFRNVSFEEGQGLVGDFVVAPSATWLAENMRFAIESGKPDLFGFSIVAQGTGHEEVIEGRNLMVVDLITGARFVDVVVDPGAGGQVLAVSESIDLVPEGPEWEEAKVYTEASLIYSDAYVAGLALEEALQRGDWQARDLAERSDYSEADIKQAIQTFENGVASDNLIVLAEAAGIGDGERRGAAARALDPTYGGRKMREKLLKIIETRRPDIYATLDVKEATEAELLNIVEGIIQPASDPTDPGGEEEIQPTENAPASPVTDTSQQTTISLAETRIADGIATLARMNAEMELRVALAECNLPEQFAESVRTQIQGRIKAKEEVTRADIDKAIADARKLVESVSKPGVVLGEGRVVEVREADLDKKIEWIDKFFEGEVETGSFREAYISMTGDRNFSGRIGRSEWQGMLNYAESHELVDFKEAINTSVWDVILQDSMNKRMVKEYDFQLLTDDINALVGTPVPISDFKTQHRIRWGGYDNLPTVAESTAYQALTTPADEEATYAVEKRGGTDTLTMEAIANDDMRTIRLIPIRMGRAAARTLHRFVLGFLRDNPLIYDGVAYFDNAHNNLTTTAFSKDQYMELRRLMRAQTELSSGEPIGIPASHLWVPGELDQASFDAFRRDTNNDADLAQTVRPTIHVVEYWTDPNDWVVTANGRDWDVIELGFWGGRQPQIFVQQNETVGSMFVSDQRTYKIRHVYGGAVIDFRTAQKAVVAP